jgi:serine/threonine protein phosphatase PrpC
MGVVGHQVQDAFVEAAQGQAHQAAQVAAAPAVVCDGLGRGVAHAQMIRQTDHKALCFESIAAYNAVQASSLYASTPTAR